MIIECFQVDLTIPFFSFLGTWKLQGLTAESYQQPIDMSGICLIPEAFYTVSYVCMFTTASGMIKEKGRNKVNTAHGNDCYSA